MALYLRTYTVSPPFPVWQRLFRMQGLPCGPPRLSAKGLDPLTGLSTSPSITHFYSIESLARSQRSSPHRPRTSLQSLRTSQSLPSMNGGRNAHRTRWERQAAMRLHAHDVQKKKQQNAARLRWAFLKEDQANVGTIPVFLLRACLRAGGVVMPSTEIEHIVQRFKAPDGRFAWLNFCNALEGSYTELASAGSSPVMPRRPPSRPSTSGGQLADPSTGRPGLYSVSQLWELKRRERQEVREPSRDRLVLVTLSPSRTNSLHYSVLRGAISRAQQRLDTPLSTTAKEAEATKSVHNSRPSTAGSIPRSSSTPVKETLPYQRILSSFNSQQPSVSSAQLAEQPLNIRFSRMYQGFRDLDVEGSGLVRVDDLVRLIEIWSIPIAPEQLHRLLVICDPNEEGVISYAEFVDALGQDSPQPEHSAAYSPNQQANGAHLSRRKVFPGEQQGTERTLAQVQISTQDAIRSRFMEMFKAFQFLDIDKSGKLSAKDLRRGLELWNIPISPSQVEELLASCDLDRDGYINFDEFKRALSNRIY